MRNQVLKNISAFHVVYCGKRITYSSATITLSFPLTMAMSMREIEPTKQINVKDILPYIGDFGRYQKLLCFVLSVTVFPIAMQPTFAYFATLTPSWRCLEKNSECPYNGTFPDTDERRCKISSNSWTYIEGAEFSIATQYKLHCKQKFLLTLIVSIFFAGWGVGAILMGWISDRYGRKVVIMPCVILSSVLALISPFIPSVYVLILCRFLIGFVFPGVLLQATILITEYVGNDMRPIAKALPSLAVNAAWMVVGLKSYVLKNWKHLSIACTVPYVFVFLFHFFIPESARWLHLNGRSDEAMKIFHKIAKWNKKELPSHVNLSTNTTVTVYKPTSRISSLFKSKSLRLKTCVHTYIWMNVALLSYGLQFAAKNLGGSIYFNFIMLAAVGLPATFIAAFINRKFGRKASTCGHLLIGALMCLSIACVPDKSSIQVVKVVLGILGRMCGSAAFFSVYLWLAEMYPTSIRAVAMGMMQVSARVGSAMSPWVVMELGKFGKWIPFVVVGVISLLGAAIGCMLPETKGTLLEETISSTHMKNDESESNVASVDT